MTFIQGGAIFNLVTFVVIVVLDQRSSDDSSRPPLALAGAGLWCSVLALLIEAFTR